MIPSATFHDIPRPIIAAGMSAMSGPTYGMNSMIPPISASVNFSSMENASIPNSPRMKSIFMMSSMMWSPIYVVANILSERMSVALIHEVVTSWID